MKYLIFILAILSSLNTLCMPKTPFFIRNDRVWVSTSWYDGDNVAKYMKFSGERDFNGLTYSRVATIKRVSWQFGDEKNAIVEEILDDTEAWLREKDGIVYLLLDGWTELDGFESGKQLSEEIIYDFNATEGDSYDAVSLYRMYEGYDGYYILGKNYVETEGKAAVGNDDVRSWEVRFGYDNDGEINFSTGSFPIVDGVGIVYGGCLYYNESFYHASGFFSYNDFYCLLDLNGNVLYPVGEEDLLPGGGLTNIISKTNVDNGITYAGNTVTMKDAQIYVYDIKGRCLLSDKSVVNVENLASGIYIAKASHAGSAPAVLKFTR